ncbi:MAG: pantoate--beta-alanine ligase [Candidatus Firestonebacteria bacterium]
MKIIKSIKEMQKWSDKIHKTGKTIGFVPTMGYFHKGHLSLMENAKKNCDFVIISIFVNPTQFVAGEDYEAYPRDIKKDTELAQKAGVDIIFLPSVQGMYPDKYSTYVNVQGNLTSALCGKFRPGHFKGVTTIVAKLFNIVKPDKAYFGQKDAQQCVVIKRMVKDLNFDLDVVVLPTYREKNGLALSSRNVYLSEEEKNKASILYKVLKYAKAKIKSGEQNANKIISEMKRKIIAVENNAKIDYISIVDPETLEDIKIINKNVLIALAVKIGKARLIDNITVKIPPLWKRGVGEIS